MLPFLFQLQNNTPASNTTRNRVLGIKFFIVPPNNFLPSLMVLAQLQSWIVCFKYSLATVKGKQPQLKI